MTLAASPAPIQRLQRLQAEIAAAAHRAHRAPDAIQLIAISKHQSIDAVRALHAWGQRAFGENYAQELAAKAAVTHDLSLEWHFVGHLQRNKVKLVLPHLAWLHSLDSVALADTIEQRATRPIACLIQINLAGETTKAGISATELPALLRSLRDYRMVRVHGLMTMPPLADAPEANRIHFRALATLLAECNRAGHYSRPLTELSMGMSDDFAVAIEAGATMIRIGTALFGKRA